MADGLALEVEEILLRELVVVEAAIVDQGQMQMEIRLQEAFVLIVLLEDLLAEAALCGGAAEQLVVVEGALEPLGEPSGDDSAAAAKLPAYDDDDFLLVHAFALLSSRLNFRI